MNELVELGTGIAASVAAGGFALDRWVARSVAVGFVAGALAAVGAGTFLIWARQLHLTTVMVRGTCLWGP